jgi:serine phosphatase RsbU (regulator of sigma subunit)/anti-sigma regulatory factor (Ser/Thr protein kinase)/PAS domain-containing protein
MTTESDRLPNDTQELLQLLYTCPVGLVSFLEDGTVTRINPEAVNLIVKTWSRLEISNMRTVLQDVWPEFGNVMNFKPGTWGRLVENHRLVSGTTGAPLALAMTVVRISSTEYLLAIVDDTANFRTENALRQSDSQFQTLFNSIDEGYSLCEMITANGEPIDYRFLKVNSLFEEMTGLVNPVGKTAMELVPGLERHWIETYARPGLRGESIRFEQGSEAMGRWFDVFAAPVEPYGHFAIVFKDQTSRRQAEQALQSTASNNAFRARLIDSLRNGLSAIELQQQAVELLREHLDTARALYVVVDENEEINVLSAQSCRASVSDITDGYKLNWQGPELTLELQLARTIVVSDAPNDLRLSLEARLAAQRLGFGSYVIVPLSRQKQLVAAMVVHHVDSYAWSIEELGLIEETARRTLRAVEHTNEDHAKRLRYERAELMANVVSNMEALASLDDQTKFVAQALVPSFADFATVEVTSADGRSPKAVLSARSSLSVAIDLSGGVRGTLQVGITQPDRTIFDHDDLLFLQDVATRAGLVMAATRLRHEEHKISIRLQQALLPHQVVWHNSVVIEARYSAASAYMEVGGDWYDTFSWPDGKIGLLVGDVVGHNLESAAQMGRLRAGTAAMAPASGSQPAALLDALQGFAHGSAGTKFATASCVVVDPQSGQLTYSSAGHLPVIVIAPDGTIQRLDKALTAPICAINVGLRPEESLVLQPNSLVLMYSDGLIERRGEDIDDGISRLESTAVALMDLPIAEFADEVISAMTGQSAPEDDVVILCFRFDPMQTNFRRSLATRVELLRELRTELREWLTHHLPNADAQNDLLLAATEACTNAIEHAYENSKTGNLIVDVSSHDRHLVLTVADQGTWRSSISKQSAEQNRGRGISIMQSVSERFTRTSTKDGTTVEMVFAKATP